MPRVEHSRARDERVAEQRGRAARAARERDLRDTSRRHRARDPQPRRQRPPQQKTFAEGHQHRRQLDDEAGARRVGARKPLQLDIRAEEEPHPQFQSCAQRAAAAEEVARRARGLRPVRRASALQQRV